MIARQSFACCLVSPCAFLLVAGLGDFTEAQLISSFHNTFQLTTPPANWEYLWNAGGAVGNPAYYVALLPNASGNYTSGGSNTLPTAAPAANVNFSFVIGIPGGHPGLGSAQTGSDGIERFAIAAYTLPAPSLVSITDSNLITTNPNSGGSSDGLNVQVFVGNNPTPAISKSTAAGVGSSVSFNGYLGTLNAGDKIYVAVGGRAADLFDSFQLSYDLVAVPEPTSAILSAAAIIGLIMIRRACRQAAVEQL